MEVTFYSNFRKKVNSTKRPSGGIKKEVLIKDKCDLHSPVLKIQGSGREYNYFQIDNTYYFINGSTVMPNNWIEYSGEVDAMATCADDIKSTTAFVTRYSGGSMDLIDTYAPPLTEGEIVYEKEQSVFPLSTTGTFIVSLADMPYPVAMSYGQILQLYNALNSEEAVNQIENTFADLSGYVRGALWIPFEVGTIGTLSIKAGKFDTGVKANYVSRETMTKNLVFPLPLDNTVLSSSNYCTLKISLPFSGTAALSVDDFRDGKSVYVTATLDTTSGALSYYISSGSNLSPVASFSGSCAVPIAIGSTSYSLASGVSGFVAGIANALHMGSGIGFFQASHSSSQTGGGGFRTDILSAVVGLTRRVPPEPLANKATVIGLPTMRTMSLGSITGFVQCHNASIESSEEIEVVEKCNSYLNSGAWIE